MQRAVRAYGVNPNQLKVGSAGRVFLRLGAVTLVAIGVALIVHPDGLGISPAWRFFKS